MDDTSCLERVERRLPNMQDSNPNFFSSNYPNLNADLY